MIDTSDLTRHKMLFNDVCWEDFKYLTYLK